MSTRCLVPDCGRPAPEGGFVCPACMTRHDTILAELDDLAHALEAAFLKQQRFSVTRLHRIGDDLDEAPLPYDDSAGHVRRRLSRALLDTVRTVAETHPSDVDRLGYPAALGYAPRAVVRITPTVAAMTGYLRRHRAWFAGTPAGAEAVNRFAAIRADALTVVDRPPDLTFLGICSHPAKQGKPFVVRRNGRAVEYDQCPEDLYADKDTPTVRCARCKTEHSVQARRDVLAAALDDQLAHAADISRGLTALDMHVTAERIRQWKARGRLTDRRSVRDIEDDRGHPLYRVGDVIDLVLATDIRNTGTTNPARRTQP